MYREKLFDKVILKIEKKDRKLILYEDDEREFATPYDFLQPFPSDLFVDPKDKMAILNFMACTDAVSYKVATPPLGHPLLWATLYT
jgi:hypothetical protein